MNKNYIPKINCRFKIRKDIDFFLGFFQDKGVLTFNEVGAFIIKQMNGEKSVEEIGQLVHEAFTSIEKPTKEVLFVAKQLQKSGFL